MNIEDYIHLYIGCEVIAKDGAEYPVKLIGIGDMGCQLWDHTASIRYWAKPDRVELVLRPLSDMTEEEAMCLTKIDKPHNWEQYEFERFTTDGFIWNDDLTDERYCYFDELNSEQFIYLLSKHFDLFGLIDAELAHDKTKVK